MLHLYLKKNTLFLFSSASSISLEYLVKSLQRAKRFRYILHRSFHFFSIFNFSFLEVISTPVPCAYVSKEWFDYILFLLFYNLLDRPKETVYFSFFILFFFLKTIFSYNSLVLTLNVCFFFPFL